jgi:hypothetical protein
MGDERVKVVDRRWFTSEGELREPISSWAEPAAETTPAPTEAASPEPDALQPQTPEPEEAGQPEAAPPGPEGPPKANLPSRALLDIVDFLAQYAMAFLTGQVAGLPRDPGAARLFIDLLTTVQERTSGQASLQEAKVLEDVLYQLRLQFMASAR